MAKPKGKSKSSASGNMATRTAKEGHTYEGRMAIHGPSTSKGKRKRGK